MWKSSSLTEWLQEHRIVQIDLHKIDRLDDKFKERSVRKYEIKTYEEIRRTWGIKTSMAARTQNTTDRSA
jgi:hypothetical protein